MKTQMDRETLVKHFSFNPDTGYFYRRLKSGKTSTHASGGLDEKGYRVISFAYRDWKASHLAWLYATGEMPKNIIDHKNGLRDDNRPDNLRDTTHSINAQNRNGPNKNRLVDLPIGVYPANNRFKAQFMVDGVKHNVGVFDTIEDAQREYVIQRRLFCPGNTL